MRRAFPTACLIVAWLCANGAVWDAAQLFAWARMFAGYAQTLSVTAALETTLDGSKPCEWCCAIAKAKETEKKQAAPAPEQAMPKLQLACEAPPSLVFAVPPGAWPALRPSLAPTRTERVPVPPPRV